MGPRVRRIHPRSHHNKGLWFSYHCTRAYLCVLSGVFPGCDLSEVDEEVLRTHISAICQDKHMLPEPQWTAKVLQLKQVGPSSCTMKWPPDRSVCR